jgi:hypothetical protein
MNKLMKNIKKRKKEGVVKVKITEININLKKNQGNKK